MRAEPNGFQVHLLNHSDTVTKCIVVSTPSRGIQSFAPSRRTTPFHSPQRDKANPTSPPPLAQTSPTPNDHFPTHPLATPPPPRPPPPTPTHEHNNPRPPAPPNTPPCTRMHENFHALLTLLLQPPRSGGLASARRPVSSLSSVPLCTLRSAAEGLTEEQPASAKWSPTTGLAAAGPSSQAPMPSIHSPARSTPLLSATCQREDCHRSLHPTGTGCERSQRASGAESSRPVRPAAGVSFMPMRTSAACSARCSTKSSRRSTLPIRLW